MSPLPRTALMTYVDVHRHLAYARLSGEAMFCLPSSGPKTQTNGFQWRLERHCGREAPRPWLPARLDFPCAPLTPSRAQLEASRLQAMRRSCLSLHSPRTPFGLCCPMASNLPVVLLQHPLPAYIFTYIFLASPPTRASALCGQPMALIGSIHRRLLRPNCTGVYFQTRRYSAQPCCLTEYR